MLNLYLLMYADDTVLFSENVHELQNMINVVNVCSNEYNLHVNLLKTKVVIFRNRGNIKSEEKWYLSGESINICKEMMYLILRKCCQIKEKKLYLVYLVKFRMIVLIQRLCYYFLTHM